MNRETMEYISRRTRNERQENEQYNRRMENSERDASYNYPEGRISARYNSYNYGDSTNTYRAEGVIEGQIERRGHFSENPSKNAKRKIGFSMQDNKIDFEYALEEALEETIDCLIHYCGLAMSAETENKSEFADSFYELAKDCLACAEFIRTRLIRHGEYDPDKQTDIEERLDKAKHMFRRL